MKPLCVFLLLVNSSLAVEPPFLTRESLEKMFQSVRAEPGQLVIQIKDVGLRFSRRRGDEQPTVNNYGETIRIKLGERVRFSTHHMSLEFRPLPAPLDKHGFLIRSHFDARSFGGGQTTTYGVVLILKGVQGAELQFLEPEKGFDPALPATDPTYQKIVKTIADAGPFASHALLAEKAGNRSKSPFPAHADRLLFEWQLRAASADPLGIRWIAENVAGVEKDHVITTAKSDPTKIEGDFVFRQPNAGFPPGQYRVEIWQTGKMIYSEKFEIKSE
jgi:hypothetical protein